MATTQIPAAFAHTCDVCGKVETNASAARPRYWSEFTLGQDAYDFQGAAVADGSIKRLLCTDCTASLTSTINAWGESRRKSA